MSRRVQRVQESGFRKWSVRVEADLARRQRWQGILRWFGVLRVAG